MTALLRALALAALMLSQAVTAAPQSPVHIVSQTWANYTNTDGTGLAWAIIRAVYQRAGLTIEPEIAPYKRAVRMVRAGKADAWVASYRDEHAFAIYPHWPHDYEITSVVGLPQAFDGWQGPESVRDRRIAHIRGYNLDRYLDTPFETYEVTTLAQAIEMAALGRVDFAAEARQDILEYFKTEPELASQLELHDLLRLGLYLGFNDSGRSRELIAAWDRHFPVLLESGKIRAIYERNGYGEDFPVDWPGYGQPTDAVE